MIDATVVSFNTNRGSVLRADAIVDQLVGLAGSSSILLLQEVSAWRSGTVSGRIVFTDATCPCAVVVPRSLIHIGSSFCSATTAAVHIGDAAYLSAYLADSGKPFAVFAASLSQLELDLSEAKSLFNVTNVIIGLDAQVQLPSNCARITGSACISDGIGEDEADRVLLMLRFLRHHGLRALSTS